MSGLYVSTGANTSGVRLNLTPTQPHQYRSGINREPIIREIDHHPQPGHFPIAHLNYPRHRTSLRTFRRQCASVTFLSGRV